MIQSPRHRKHKECQGSQHLKRYDARDQGHPKMDFGIGEIEPGKLAWNNYIMIFHCSTGIQTLRMAMAGGSAGRAKDNDNQLGWAQRLSQIDSKVITLCDSYLKEPHKDISHIMRQLFSYDSVYIQVLQSPEAKSWKKNTSWTQVSIWELRSYTSIENQHVPEKGTMSKGNFIFQLVIFRRYVKFPGSFLSHPKLGW